MRLKPLNEQVMVISGATSGIGLATAQAAAQAGAKLVLVARNDEALAEVAARLGPDVMTVDADVGDDDWADRAADAALDRFGRVDTWVNNAAAAMYAKVQDTTLEDHRRVFEVGYFGLVRGSLKAAALLKAGGGAVINVGSVLSERAMHLQGTYSAMKHAVRGFTDALRMELIEEGAPVSVTLIKPSAMHTPYPEHARNLLDQKVRIPPIAYDPRLVADAILFAAENPKRELTVGGNGWLLAKLGAALPGPMDMAMAAVGRLAQKGKAEAAPGARDNLHEPRADGRIEGREPQYVRRTSLWLEAQKRPVAATLLFSGLTMAALAAAGRRR